MFLFFLTTRANELVAPLHDRMPVILRPADFNLWLSPDVHDPERLKGMFEPLPGEMLETYRVSELVNNVRYDGNGCIARV